MRNSSQTGCALQLPQNYAPARTELVPGGDTGIAATIGYMKSAVFGNQGVRSFRVREFTLQAVRGVARGMTEVDAVFQAIRDEIEFRGEYQEYLQSPEATINLGAGDCDDQAVLAAAMLNSLGFETRFKTVALHDSPGELSHVYIEVRDKQSGAWTSMDTTVAESYPGWEPDGIARSEVYSTNGSSDLLWLALGGAVVAALVW